MVDRTFLASRTLSHFLWCAALFGATSTAFAQAPSVLVLGADDVPYDADVVTRLQSTGLFGTVATIDARFSTPTLAQLQAYDAVITWSNWDYSDAVTMGNTLADYVDAGGGVVVATFANCEPSPTRFLGGRWLIGNYEVILSQGGYHGGAAQMGVVHVPSHPIMTGVSTFDGNFAYRALVTNLAAGAVDIADWTDGTALVVAHGTLHNRVDLNFFPPSQAADSASWLLSTDGARLMGNAVLYTTGGGHGSTPFCSGDGSGTACPCGNAGAAGNGCASSVNTSGANLATTGQPSLANDTLVLRGSGMPNSSALYFQGLTQVQGGLGVVFGDGLRCAGGTIVRLKTVTNAGGLSQFPNTGDPSVSVRGSVSAPATRTYQVWYRNAAPFCNPTTYNLTNGVQVAWVN